MLANIDLAPLTSKLKEIVRQVIKEECDVFSGDGNGIGDIRSHAKIKLILKTTILCSLIIILSQGIYIMN